MITGMPTPKPIFNEMDSVQYIFRVKYRYTSYNTDPLFQIQLSESNDSRKR